MYISSVFYIYDCAKIRKPNEKSFLSIRFIRNINTFAGCNSKIVSCMIRMSVNRILPFLLLLVLFTSCNRKYKIEGSSSVTSLDGKMLFLKTLRDGQWVNVDSAEVIHGHFKMKGRADSVMMVTLYMDHEALCLRCWKTAKSWFPSPYSVDCQRDSFE